jgi:lipoprotein signal peptidase
VWPVFNVADSAVVIGALFVAWRGFRDRGEEPERATPPPEPARPG